MVLISKIIFYYKAFAVCLTILLLTMLTISCSSAAEAAPPVSELASWQAFGIEAAFCGGMLSIGIHHLVMFALRRKERVKKYFGLICVLIGVHTFFSGSLVGIFAPGISWQTAFRTELVLYNLGLPIIVMFVYTIYPQEMPWNAVKLISWLGLLLCAAIPLLPVEHLVEAVPVFYILCVMAAIYFVYCLGRAVRHKREGALFAFIASCAYTASIIMDTPDPSGRIDYSPASTHATLTAIFLISIILSIRSSRAVTAVETLSRELRELNMGLENKIRERTYQLERTNRSLEQMNEDLSRLETSRRHLLSNISHDLGTPMTLIQGYVEALLDGLVSDPEKQHKYLKIIHYRISGLNRLISDLFQLSKLEARQLQFAIQPISVCEFMRYFSERYEQEVQNAGLSFSIKSKDLRPAGLPEGLVKADLDRIDQVLTNIIYNAIKHTPRGGLIELLLSADEHSLVVQVQDNGMGIDPEDLPHIFDRFYKKDKSRNTSGGGSGLGLSIAKEIIEYHGGKIWAQSRKGQGACVSFMLPLAANSAYAED